MGFKRFLKRNIRVLWIADTVKNIKEEGSIVYGLKKTIKEDLCEDNPITSIFYKSGQFDGKIDGYQEASDAYESKLLEQADQFLEQEKIFKSEVSAYETLLDEYEVEINILSEKIGKTEVENEYLHQLLLRDRKLRKMVG